MKHSLADASKSKDKTQKTAVGKVNHRAQGIHLFDFIRPGYSTAISDSEPRRTNALEAGRRHTVFLTGSATEKGSSGTRDGGGSSSVTDTPAIASTTSLINGVVHPGVEDTSPEALPFYEAHDSANGQERCSDWRSSSMANYAYLSASLYTLEGLHQLIPLRI